MKEIRIVELFAGVGGFRVGLERTSNSFKTVWSNQWEPGRKTQWAYDCYVKHFGDNKVHVNEDIALVKHQIPDHDLLVGGFPCQDYSVATTNANGIKGKKGVLWWNINDILINKQPKFALFENVDRLLKSPTSQRGRDFGIILYCLHKAGYNVEWRVINAADYGFPQKRRRVFIFATRKEIFKNIFKSNLEEIIMKNGFFKNSFQITNYFIKKSEYNLSKYKNLKQVSDSFQASFENSGAMINGKIMTARTESPKIEGVTLGDVLENRKIEEYFFVREKEEKMRITKSSKRILRLSKEGFTYMYSEGKMNFPDNLLSPGRTMLTSEGAINRSSHVVTDKKTRRLRFLTPIECERLNGFDDDWTNTGMSIRNRYFCMGNALVVPLIEIMGKELICIWKKKL